MPHAIVHYHELALKGRNRGFFEQRLVHHLRSSLKDLENVQVHALPGRICLSFSQEQNWEPIRAKISRTFGVVNFLMAQSIPINGFSTDLTALKKAIAQDVTAHQFHTFRVTTKRAEKRFRKTSVDIDREIGAFLCEQTGKRVNLSRPDLTVFIEVLEKEFFFSLQREKGPGGLPTGTGGKVMCLQSGGIDSPVASYRMMKRGCKAVFVHFHSRPYLSRASEDKVKDLVTHLTAYQLYSRLYLVPFGETQSQIVLKAPAPVRVVLYRRMMVRIAESLAKKEQAWGLVTGDSLGQVASQTPENLRVITAAASYPILRPLIGMDKIEITEEAKKIGTFDTSIEPDQDCCTLFVPPHPNTKCQLSEIQEIEQRFDIPSMLNTILDKIELAEYTYPK